MAFALSLIVVMSSAPAIYADGLVINEFLAINDSVLADEDGEYSDWIEIYNGSTNTVNLDGWFLTDDQGTLDKWRIPNVSLSTGDYLVVFASNKDRDDPSGELHTDFKLSGSGEYLALVEPDHTTIHYDYSPGYPSQLEDISFGIGTNLVEVYRYFATPTPGSVNGGAYDGLVEDTKFTVDRGFYTNTFQVAITTATAGATIHYTLDGSTPTQIDGTEYTGSITVSNTTCLRAVAWKPGYRSTDVDTHTYLFVGDIAYQSPNGEPPGPGWPTGDVNGQRIVYGMDPDVFQDPRYTNLIDDALLAIPSFSVVTDLPNLFDSSIGIFVNATKDERPWERPCSIELLNPDGSKGFQINGGIRMRGGYSRTDNNPKHAFRLFFRQDYGESKLRYALFENEGVDEFDKVDLRTANNYAWSFNYDSRNTIVRDVFSRDAQGKCGQPYTRSRYYHLYLDGHYWGLFQTQERASASYAESYFGDDKDDYDVVKPDNDIGRRVEATDGNLDAYEDLWEIAVSAAGWDNTNYFRAQGLNVDGTRNHTYTNYLDAENVADYMIITYFTGDKDGPGSRYTHPRPNNFYGIFSRRDPDGFKYFEHDSEHSLDTGVSDMVNPLTTGGATWENFNPHWLHEQLTDNSEYQVLFGDRVYKHLYNEGCLVATTATNDFMARAAQIDMAIIAESARWGDNVNSSSPKTKDDHWIPALNTAVNWINNRLPTVLGQLRGQGWYPNIDPPVFNRRGGSFTNTYDVTMTAAETIYYTIDGSDPRERITGNPAGTEYTGSPVQLTQSAIVKTRARSAGGEWSALNEVVFTLAAASPLRVTELMYNPRDPSGTETNSAEDSDQFEFVELQNRGGGTLGLAGLSFTNGISFDFSYGDVFSLTQGEYVVVVSDIDAFTNRYGSSMLIAGEYSGSLGNGGERLALSDGVDSNLLDFTYNDARGWPLSTDGAGHSLVATDMTNQPAESLDYSGNWRASAYIDGSPGEADPDPIKDVVLNEIAAHTDYTNAAKPEYDSNDWIELYNTRTTGVSLANWYLSDSASDLRKWSIPATNTLASEGLKAFDEVSGFHSPITNGFGLDKAGEQVFLSYLPGTSEDRVADCISFKGQENGLTLGRYTDGDDYWYTLAPTPAAANAAPGSQVVISEIMYHPSPTVANPENNTNDEYVKIYNPLFVPVELWTTAGPWRLDGGIGYTFPSNTTIAAKSEVMIVSFDPVTNITARNDLLAHYGLDIGDVTFLGPYSEQLDNQSDRVALEKPLDPDPPSVDVSWVIVDEVIYSDSDPWPPTPDGSGPPLYRADLDGAGSDPSSWSTDPPAANTFVIRSLSISSGTPLVTWGGLTNGDWYVERSTNLSDGFTRIATSTVATSYHDTALPSSVSESYYRIAVSVAAVPVYTRNTAGYLQLNVPSNGYGLVSVPFQKFPLYRGVVSSNTTLTITDDAASWTAGEFKQGAAGQDPTGTNSFYVEIRDKASAWEGKMFPIATNSATELQIEGGAVAGLTAEALAGASYAIVPEQRVRDIFGEPDSPLLVRGGGVGSADNILFWSGTSWQRIYNKDSGNPVFLQDHWLLGNTVVDDKAIGRDASFFLFRQATSNTVLHLIGEVPAYNQWIDLDPGYNLVGGCWIEPVPIGDTSLQGTLKGGGNSSTADAILDWGGSSWLGAVYYKSSGNPPFLVGHWVRGTTIMDSSFTFMPTSGYFIKNSASNVWHKARTWND
jgi:hypothetical protein